MLKISDNAINQIVDSIVCLIRQGKLVTTAEGGGRQTKENEKDILKSKRSRLVKPLEHDFRKGIIPLFEKQKDKVIGILQGRKAANYNINGAIRVPTTQEEIKSFTEYVLPKITAMMAIAGKHALSELEIGIAFDIMNPKVIEWLQAHAAEAVKEIGVTTKHLLKQTLIEGLENGESIAKLTERIRQAYLPLDMEGYRAKRIAMTETKNAFSQGNLQGYRQSELKGKKGILLGPNPCDFCISLYNMGLIDLDDTWGGYESPAFHPNCHCDIYFRPE